MGSINAKAETPKLEIHKEYTNIQFALCDKKGTFMYALLKEFDKPQICSTVYKIDCCSNIITDFFPMNIRHINSFMLSDCDRFLLVVSKMKIYSFDLSTKKSFLICKFQKSLFSLNDQLTYYQGSTSKFFITNLASRSFVTHRANFDMIGQIKSIYNGNEHSIVYLIGPLLKTEKYFILRFNLKTNKIEGLHKSCRQIIKLECCESNGLVFASKLSGTITLYDNISLENKKNLRASGVLIDTKLVRDDSNKILAIYQKKNEFSFVFWNTHTFAKDKKFYFSSFSFGRQISILFSESEKTYLKVGSKVLFLEFAKKEKVVTNSIVFKTPQIFEQFGNVSKEPLMRSRGKTLNSRYNFKDDSNIEELSKDILNKESKLFCGNLSPSSQHTTSYNDSLEEDLKREEYISNNNLLRKDSKFENHKHNTSLECPECLAKSHDKMFFSYDQSL
jgi:hypothetical protein